MLTTSDFAYLQATTVEQYLVWMIVRTTSDPGYNRGVMLFWAFEFSSEGSLARITPLFLCDLTFFSVFYIHETNPKCKGIAAPKQLPQPFSFVRYRVTRVTGPNTPGKMGV